MKFSDVIQLLDPEMIAACEVHNEEADLFCVQYLADETVSVGSETLYLLNSSDIGRLSYVIDSKANYVILNTNKNSLLLPDLKKSNYLILDSTSEPVEIFNLISDYLGAEMKMHQIMSDLASTLFKNRGLQSIVDAACEAMNNPIFVVDPSGVKTAYSLGKVEPAPDSLLWDFLSEHHEFSDRDSKLQQYLSQVNEKLLQENKPVRFYNDFLKCDQMISFVRVRGIEIGHVFMLAMQHSFSRFDEMIFDRLVALIGQELQKNPLYTKNFHDIKAHFLHNLITVPDLSAYTIHRMMTIMGITFPHSKFCILTIMQKNEMSTDHALETLSGQYTSKLPNHISLIHEHCYILLLNIESRNDIYISLYGSIKKIAESNHLLIGISNVYDDVSKTFAHYQQALEVLDFLRRFPGSSLAGFSQIAPMYLFDLAQEKTDLIEFCVPELLDLLAMDQEYHTELMLTLFLYLENFGNVAKTASELFIHRNTLLYRMNKIKEVLHNDLGNGEILFHLMLSFRILQRLLLYNPESASPKERLEDTATEM